MIAVTADERIQVGVWRAERALELGFTLDEATEIALDPAVDWHRLARLLEAGCPPETALRIEASL